MWEWGRGWGIGQERLRHSRWQYNRDLDGDPSAWDWRGHPPGPGPGVGNKGTQRMRKKEGRWGREKEQKSAVSKSSSGVSNSLYPEDKSNKKMTEARDA